MGKSILKKIIIGVLAIAIMAAPINVSAASFSAGSSKYLSVSEAADIVREEMLVHTPVITVYIKSTQNNPEGIFYDLQDEVMKETDKGDEGDYMYWDIDSQSPYYTYRAGKSGKTTYYYYEYNITIEYFTTLEQKTQVDEKVGEIIQSFGFTELTTDYEKVKTIYDYICNNVKYAQDLTQNIIYTSWSALFNQEAVCQGYAQLMYRMLKEVGISCRVVPGYGRNADIKHGWNIVKIGDYYYNIDATWDSQKRTGWSSI